MPSTHDICPLSLHDALPIWYERGMRAVVTDGCGCFPTGRHYAGIAHLLRAVVRGLAEDLAAAEAPWDGVPIAVLDVETTGRDPRSEEHTSELQSLRHLVCRLRTISALFPYTTLFRSGMREG